MAPIPIRISPPAPPAPFVKHLKNHHMKKIILTSAVLLAFVAVSCKKPYTCTCTTTTTYSGGSPDINKSHVKEYSEKMTQKQAESACDHEEQAIKSTFDASFTENGSQPAFGQVSTTCELQ